MGVAVPQVITTDRASNNQVIDGSLRFDSSKAQVLKRTPGSAGDRDNYTGSVWVKRTAFAPDDTGNSNVNYRMIFSAGTNSGSNTDDFGFYKNAGGDDNKLRLQSYPGSTQYEVISNAKYRDTGWYHVVWNYNGTTANMYVNGEQIVSFDTNTQNGGSGGHLNNTVQHVIGGPCDLASNLKFDGYMSQFYWIDGQTVTQGTSICDCECGPFENPWAETSSTQVKLDCYSCGKDGNTIMQNTFIVDGGIEGPRERCPEGWTGNPMDLPCNQVEVDDECVDNLDLLGLSGGWNCAMAAAIMGCYPDSEVDQFQNYNTPGYAPNGFPVAEACPVACDNCPDPSDTIDAVPHRSKEVDRMKTLAGLNNIK